MLKKLKKKVAEERQVSIEELENVLAGRRIPPVLERPATRSWAKLVSPDSGRSDDEAVEDA